MKQKYYIIGDPVIREKLAFAGKCAIYALAFIGFIALLTVICMISAW